MKLIEFFKRVHCIKKCYVSDEVKNKIRVITHHFALRVINQNNIKRFNKIKQ